jgi:hypothetical protein
LLAPVVLVGGWLIAGALQPASFSPVRETISVLAGHSGTDRWVMTAALLLVGSCQIATGAGLTGVRTPARILLTLTGLCTLGIAATPEPATGPTSSHLAFAVSCVVTTALWPVFVARRGPVGSWILSVYGCATVTAVFAGLSCWLLIEARDGGGNLGLAERLTSGVLGLFPLVVALALRQSAPDAGNQGQRGQGGFRHWQAVTPIGRRTVASPAWASGRGAIFRGRVIDRGGDRVDAGLPDGQGLAVRTSNAMMNSVTFTAMAAAVASAASATRAVRGSPWPLRRLARASRPGHR